MALGILAGLALGAGAAGVNNMMAQKNAQTSYVRQQELMRQQAQMNAAAQRESHLNNVVGMKMAGLNPALANEGSFGPLAVGQGNADMPQTIPFNAQDALAIAQIDNVQAQTENVKENTKNIEETNRRRLDENNAFVNSYKTSVELEIKDLEDQLKKNPNDEGVQKRLADLRTQMENLEDPNYRLTVGAVEGIKKAAEASKANFDVVNNYLEGKFNKEVALRKLGPGFEELLDATARMPVYQKRMLEETITKIKQEIAESESREELNDQTVLKIQKEIEQIGNAILHANLNDPVYIRTRYGENSKEWQAWTDQEWREQAMKVGASVIQGLATGGALGAVNKMLNPGSGSNKRVDDQFDRDMRSLKRNRQIDEAFKSIPEYSGYTQGNPKDGVQQMNKHSSQATNKVVNDYLNKYGR